MNHGAGDMNAGFRYHLVNNLLIIRSSLLSYWVGIVRSRDVTISLLGEEQVALDWSKGIML